MISSFNQEQYEKFISEELRSIPRINFVGFINNHGRLHNYTSSTPIPLAGQLNKTR